MAETGGAVLMRVLPTLSFVTLLGVVALAQNAAPTAIPNGLPEWAFNLVDKVQPQIGRAHV